MRRGRNASCCSASSSRSSALGQPQVDGDDHEAELADLDVRRAAIASTAAQLDTVEALGR
ncbi:MAG TPA: hypothetical protein VK915_07925 [Gaiellaceae bacterium]|nr:hypothetical protein [Gaiellaceae bacterium]